MAELLIKGGMVIDGTGNAGYEADVFVKDGKIAKIVKIAKNEKNKTDQSDFAAAAVQVLDARGKLVTPGFINMHSHSDCSVAMYPEMESGTGDYHRVCRTLRTGGGTGGQILAVYVPRETGIVQRDPGAHRRHQSL